MVLGQNGFNAQGFGDGHTFFADVRPRTNDLIILDIDLPGLSGTDIAAVLQARGLNCRIAVVSGIRARAFRAAIAEIQPIAAFRKPLDPQQLLRSLGATA